MDAPRLRSLLLRGSLIAAANWPVVIARGISESVVRALAGIPVAGAAMLLLLVSVPNASPGPAIDSAAAALTALATVPAALAGVAVSAIVAARRDRVRRGDQGGQRRGDRCRRGARPCGDGRIAARPGPLRGARVVAGPVRGRLRALRPALRAPRSRPRRARGRRRSRLRRGSSRQAYRTFVSLAASWWIAPAVVAVSAIALALSIVAELGYRLTQLVMVAGDCGLRAAITGASGFMRRHTLVVARVCVAALVLSALTFAITLVAAAAFGLVSFVPVAGVAVLPLQAAVWVVRGLMLPFIDLAALAAYASVYPASPEGSVPERSGTASPALSATRASPAGAPEPRREFPAAP